MKASVGKSRVPADRGPLGSAGFGITTFVLSVIDANLVGGRDWIVFSAAPRAGAVLASHAASTKEDNMRRELAGAKGR
jgi:succinate-acetate transporter protein